MRKALVISLVFTGLYCAAFAQKKYTDSLNAVLSNTVSPIQRFNIITKVLRNVIIVQGGNIDSARCGELLQIAQQLRSDSLFETSYSLIGNYFAFSKGDNVTGLEYYFKALALANKMKDKRKIDSLSFDVSVMYFTLQNNEEAVKYVRRGGENLPDKSYPSYYQLLAQYQRGLAIYYLLTHHPDSALHYGQAMYTTGVKIKNVLHQFNALTFIASAYTQLGAKEKAKTYFNNALAISDSVKMIVVKLRFYNNYIPFLLSNNKIPEALRQAKQLLNLANQKNNNTAKLAAAGLMRRVFDSLHNTDSAYFYSRMEAKINADIFNQGNIDKIQTLAFKERLLGIEENRIKADYQSRLRQYALLTGFAVSLVIALFLYKNNLHRKKANDLLQMKNLQIEQFYTNISHEFRTPLTIILGMAQKVAERPAEHLKDGTEMIKRNGRSLLKLVNEMLDLSKLQNGKMVLSFVKGDIITFLRYIVESFHSLSESQKKQLHFLSDTDSYITEYDAEKMRQIISNLLSNAIKFTPEDGNIYISVNSNKAPGKADTTLFVIKIRDTGIGIPEDKQPFIFDRFYQLDNSNTRTTEGTGIGLSLTKELVKLMKGEISVKSPPRGVKKGTEFTVELPFKRLPAGEEIIVQPYMNETGENIVFNGNNTPGKSGEILAGKDDRPLILLVEDNADVVAYTAFCLPDYRLAVAKDGVEGFEQAVEIIPDLIISDVMMPRMDGFGLLRKIKADELTSHIPVIMLTAKADKGSRMEGITEGADAYLEKPFNNEELQLHIKKLLELRKTLQLFYLKKAGLSNMPLPVTGPNERFEGIAAKAEDKFVIKIREVVEAHISDAEFNLEQLCGEVFMSHSKLHRKLDALTGCAPNKFIRIIRLKKAKELLKDNELSISSIAIDCGFNDPGYFSRVFKQEFGITPNEWRADVKEW